MSGKNQNPAWFKPFTFLGQLSSNINAINPAIHAEVFAPIHENLHYIQCISTYYGCFSFMSYWKVLTKLAKILSCKDSSQISLEEKELLINSFNSHRNELKVFDHFVYVDTTDSIEEGPLFADFETSANIEPAYCKILVDGERRLIGMGATAIMESMALALELWFGASKQKFNWLHKQTDPSFLVYTIGIETLKKTTGWDDFEKICAAMVLLGDFSLNHPLQKFVFLDGAMKIGKEFKKPPAEKDLLKIYDFLLDEYEETDIKNYRDELWRNNVAPRAFTQVDSDKFDKAVSSLFQTMLMAKKNRDDKPDFFVEKVLFDQGNKDFINRYHMPIFLHSDDIYKLSNDERKLEAVLFLEAMNHRLMTVVHDGYSKACPFIQSSICGFDRDQLCKKSPWLKNLSQNPDLNNEMHCIYSFSEETLRSANN